MTSMMFRNRQHALLLGAAAVVALLSLAAVVAMSGFLSPGSSQKGNEPTVKSAVQVTRAAPGDARPEGGRAERGGAQTPARTSCASCGTVEAIRTLEVRGDATGSQELEHHLSRRVVYRVTVRLDDGSYRTLSQAMPPSIAVGEKVRIADGAVVARQ